MVALGAGLECASLSAASYCRFGGQSSLVRCHGSIVGRAIQRIVGRAGIPWAALKHGDAQDRVVQRGELKISDKQCPFTGIPLCGIYLPVVFIESKVFTRRLHELAKDSADTVLADIENGLLENPVRGDMVKGLGGVRKARISNPARGKSKRGGFRYMYLYLERREHVHLLFLFDKDEQEDLNPAQRAFLRQLVERIKDY